MKKLTLLSMVLFLCIIGLTLSIQAQTTIVLKPNANQGKDAFLLSNRASTNYGDHPDIAAVSWTNRGEPANVRSLIDFDMSNIPNDVIINSAHLSLYSYDSQSNGAHSNDIGSNQSVIRRVTSNWIENSVNWNNQPFSTSENQIILQHSNFLIEDYLDIDVTSLVNDMRELPNSSFGFLLKLTDEEPLNRLVFASSDNVNPDLHPQLIITYSKIVQPDNCITIRPNGINGKDAFLLSNRSNINYSNHPDFAAVSWTNRGELANVRSLIDFDMSNIPNDVIINSAHLSLYSYDSQSNGAHSQERETNQSVIKRITSDWKESRATWNNQPSSTTQNQVYLHSTSESLKDYLDIDVTSLVNDMKEFPSSSFGFLFKIINEEPLNRLIFASSDNVNPDLHPQLVICYTKDTTISTKQELFERNFKLYPNPAQNVVTISTDDLSSQLYFIEISNYSGKIIESIPYYKSNESINVINYPKGLYFVKIHTDEFTSTKKLIIQ